MKRIEKDIKKKSAQLIESSLPEISSLDNIPVKKKSNRDLPLYLVPLALAACAVVAILIPISMKVVAPNGITPSVKPSDNTSISYTHGDNSNNNRHSYNYNFGDYKPSLNSFNEVAYYSYYAYQEPQANSNALAKRNNLLKFNDAKDEDDRSDYIDNYGRYHYPISLDNPFTFSEFLFFEFDSENCPFLEERIGNGHIHGLAVATNIFNEHMLILKNGDQYYSCLRNGAGAYNFGRPAYMEFSSHKTIEGFDVVKDTTNKRNLTLGFGGQTEGQFYIDQLNYIDIEGMVFSINPETVFFDDITVSCSIEELRERFDLDPNFQVVDDYGGVDELAYEATTGDTSFTLNEYTGTFFVSENALYLDQNKLFDLNGATKIYASEINKDKHRDLVFESIINEKRTFNIYDVKRNTYLYQKAVSDIDSVYDYYLDMVDNRVVVKMLEPGTTDDKYLVDYGYFAYYFTEGITISWKNYFELTSLEVVEVYEMDGETPVNNEQACYCLNSNTSYIVEMKMRKYGGYKNPDYPMEGHPIRCESQPTIDNLNPATPSWELVSENNDIYRYKISYQESGYSECKIYFHRYSFILHVAVDFIPEAAQY